MEDSQTRTVVKTKLKHLLSKKDDLAILKDAIDRTNKIVENAYIFIKFVVLEEYAQNKPISDILEKEFVKACFHVLTTEKNVRTKGRQMKAETKQLTDYLYDVLDTIEKKGFVFEKQSKVNLSGILEYEATKMTTMYSNNIIMRYIAYLKKFIRYNVIKTSLDGKKNLTKDENKEVKKQVFLILTDFKKVQDYNYQSDSKHHSFIDTYKKLLVPPITGDDPFALVNMLESDTLLFLKPMIAMNIFFEDYGMKLLSPLCLRTEFSRKHISLDAKCIVELFVDKRVVENLKSNLECETFKIGKTQYEWMLPNLTNKESILKSPKQLFPEEYKTKFSELQWKTISAMLKTELFKHIFKLGIPNSKSPNLYLKKNTFVFNNHIDTDGYAVSIHYCKKDYFGKRYHPKITIAKDLPYLSSLDDMTLEKLKDKELVSGDPGKGNIMATTNGKKTTEGSNKTKVIFYTSSQRTKESNSIRNRKEHHKRLKSIDAKTGKSIVELQGQLSQYKKKSCVLETFLQYVVKRKEISVALDLHYKCEVQQRMKFRSFVGKASSVDQYLHTLEKAYGSDPLIVIGNWGRNPNMKYTSPSPGVGLRRIMKKKFKHSYIIDERLTSTPCPCCEHKQLCHPLKRNGKDIHHLLRCENENCNSRWWNRDVVGSLNILKVVSYFLATGERHPVFKLTTAS